MIESVVNYFMALQTTICTALEALDGRAAFSLERIIPPNGGLSQPRVLADGAHIEKAAVQFTHSKGSACRRRQRAQPAPGRQRLPSRCDFTDRASLQPARTHYSYEPAVLLREADEPVWYFGGGYDLTPCYPEDEDVRFWHQTAKDAVGDHYQPFKATCDDYFFLSHRGETRGVGGIFFDDWTEGGFDDKFCPCEARRRLFFNRLRAHFRSPYEYPFTDAQRDFQLYRRGRYAEFNLAIDRGTKYGLQSGRRIESVLASLPPLVKWVYDYQPEPGSREADLLNYLKPRNWL